MISDRNQISNTALTEEILKETVFPLFTRALAGDNKRGEIYLANHSLGRPLDQTANDLAEALSFWYDGMDGAWQESGWTGAAQHYRNLLSKILGLPDGNHIIPKNNAGQALRSILNAFEKPGSLRIVSTNGEFDSADFILKTYTERGKCDVSWVSPSDEKDHVPIFSAKDIIAAITPGTDLVVMSHVFYRTGQILENIPEICAHAHSVGAIVMLDTYHSAGIVPVDIIELGVDFAMGGCYKYLRGGAGAGFLAIHPDQISRNWKTLDTGWFAKKNPMAFTRERVADRANGGNAWLDSTPPALIPYQAKAGLELVLKLGIGQIRTYNLYQQSILRSALRSRGVQPFEPTVHESFAGFSLVYHPKASDVVAELRKKGVCVDARANLIRFCPDLLNTADQLEKAAEITSEVFIQFEN